MTTMTRHEAAATLTARATEEIHRQSQARQCESVETVARRLRADAREIQITTHRSPATRLVLTIVRAVYTAAQKTDAGHTWEDAGGAQSHGGRCYSHRERCANCGVTRRAYHDPDNAASGAPTRWYAKD